MNYIQRSKFILKKRPGKQYFDNNENARKRYNKLGNNNPDNKKPRKDQKKCKFINIANERDKNKETTEINKII